jgi:hypothetical protein
VASTGRGRLDNLWPFLGGAVAGAAGLLLVQAMARRPRLDPRLIRASPDDPDVPPTVIVPGILGSELIHPDGTQAWLNAGNALGHHDLSLPLEPGFIHASDDLVPAGLIGVDAVLPRLFGFTEYGDLLDLLENAGFHRDRHPLGHGAVHHVFTYDWRRDLVDSARRLGQALDARAEASGEPEARFNLVAHSMGGLVARYYLRFGGAEPGGPVTWAGARRIRNLVVVATPNGGGIPSLDAILNGNRVGLSTTTLAGPVIASFPSIYQLLPHAGTTPLLDERAEPLDLDLLDPSTWERLGWGAYEPGAGDRSRRDPEAERAFLHAALARAKAFHAALSATPAAACPCRVVVLGGDCLPTLARAVVPERPGESPRFDPVTRAESRAMYEAGDGRVTRASVLASHLPLVEEEPACGLPEIRHAFFGAADHHGIYREPTFQSLLLRLLLQPARRRGTALRGATAGLRPVEGEGTGFAREGG